MRKQEKEPESQGISGSYHSARQSRAEGRFLGYFRQFAEVSAMSCRDVGNDLVAGSEREDYESGKR